MKHRSFRKSHGLRPRSQRVIVAFVSLVGVCCAVGRAGALQAGFVPSGPAQHHDDRSFRWSESAWVEVPDSTMDSVFVAGVDDRFRSAPNSWSHIQNAWSGGVCIGRELFVWGGGHGDGAHNGLLAVDVRSGNWRRVTEPSPIWTEETCPDGVCPAVTGDCPLGTCNTGPDGRPVARHTYNLIASDGDAIYVVGGGIWSKGSHGDPNSAWRFDLKTGEWSLLPASPVNKAHGNVIFVDGALYHVTAQGYAIMDVATGAWTKPSKLRGHGGQTTVVYVPDNDRFYAFGNGRAHSVSRRSWGDEPENIPDAPPVVADKYVGAVYHPIAKRVLIWNGGAKLHSFDPSTSSWETITPVGDPGPLATRGTFGRFSYCDGRVVLVNGTDQNLFYLGSVQESTASVANEPSPPPAPKTRAERRTTSAATARGEKRAGPSGRPDSRSSGKSIDDTSTSENPPAPYYESPPGDALVQQECGAETEWETIDVKSDDDVLSLRGLIKQQTRAVVRVHWREAPFPVIRIKGGRCVKVVGVPGPTGELPIVGGVNATSAFRGTVRRGGIVVERLDISPGKARRHDAGMRIADGDCIGIPNDQMFAIVRDSKVSRCGHHAFITSHAHQLYVEIGRSHFEQASSHLAYIDHIAMAYVYDSTFQSPGWGHALRCIALRCIVHNVKLSNVQLDGKVLDDGGDNPLRPKRRYVGMAPLEIYTCGENEVSDADVVFLPDDRVNAGFAAIVRGREAFQTCDVGEIDNGHWTSLAWTDENFLDSRRWATVTPLTTRVHSMKIKCVGTRPCSGWSVRGNYPTMNNEQKKELTEWIREKEFVTWSSLVAAIPRERPEWTWLASVTLPSFRDDFMRGKITNKVPLPVPLPGWKQRTRVVFSDVVVDGGDLLDEPSPIRSYCYGIPPSGDEGSEVCEDQFDGAHYRQAFISIDTK